MIISGGFNGYDKIDTNYKTVQVKTNEQVKEKAVYYIVRRGDTLSGIASRYGTTVSAIQKLNPSLIKNIDQIKAGRKIRVK